MDGKGSSERLDGSFNELGHVLNPKGGEDLFYMEQPLNGLTYDRV